MRVWMSAIGLLALAACDPGPGRRAEYLSEELDGCLFASPLLIESRGEPFVLAAPSSGRLHALDPRSGKEAWRVSLPVSEGLQPLLVATPARVGQRLVVVYQGFDPALGEDPLDNEPSRQEHRVAVVDLDARALDPAFEPVILDAEVAVSDSADGDHQVEEEEGQHGERTRVRFNPPTQLSRAAVALARGERGQLGKAYVGFGNKGDVQPWHGWVFELDLDRWQRDGAEHAIASVLLTTPQAECGEDGSSGMRDMRCGGGVWSPAGPQVFETEAGYELLVPTGNGRTDLAHGHYASGLLRMGEGLRFDPGCDPALCAELDPGAPTVACLESCANLFVPRLASDDPPLRPESGVCDGLGFLECYAELDYDFGASSPVRLQRANGATVYVQPAKDGHVYLIDGEHMGRMLDRVKLVEVCGTERDECAIDWAGMIVTQPAVVDAPVEGERRRLILVPTFMYDRTHPAGVVALELVETEGGPRLRQRWQAPDFASAEAVARFRSHPSRIALSDVGGVPVAWIVDVRGFKSARQPGNDLRPARHGELLAIDVRSGAIVARKPLQGRGQRYLLPLIGDGLVYVGSCERDSGPSYIEGHTIELD